MQLISQIAVMIFGASAIWLVGRKESWRRWGYICGLISQPFWIYSFVSNGQWGMLGMTLFYTYSWAMGIYNYWLKPDVKQSGFIKGDVPKMQNPPSPPPKEGNRPPHIITSKEANW